MKILCAIKNHIDKILRTNKSEKDVAEIKKHTIHRVDEVTKSLNKQSTLQKQVIKKTQIKIQTYLITRG